MMPEPFTRDVIKSAADVLIAEGGPVAMVGQAMKDDLASGGRAAWAARFPAAKSGGDLGRGDAITESETILRAWRRKKEDRSDLGWAMDFRRDACDYFEKHFLGNQEGGVIPEDIYLRDIHLMIESGALLHGGKIISCTTIRRRFSKSE